MLSDELEHLLRAAKDVTKETEFMVVGAAALLGTVRSPPRDLAMTIEADMYPVHRPELADEINGSIGELSPFHDQFRVYAHGVGPETAILPAGWESRVVRFTGPGANGAVALCLEVQDLAASKLAAARPKDVEFVRNLLKHRLLNPQVLVSRLQALPGDEELRARAVAAFERAHRVLGRGGPSR
jgi:hypothetical protein